MNKMTLMFLVVAGLLLRTLAHTPAETNAVVEAALDYLQQAYPDNWETNFIEVAEEEIPDTWMTFLGGDETNGWTHAEKRAAFDWYLASLGSADCRSLPAIGKWRIKATIGQCDLLNYTNSWPYMKALALNPRGVCYESAIELSIKFGPVDDAMTDFVETILTNVARYTSVERGASACGHYIDKIQTCAGSTNGQNSVVNRAIRMFYKNRRIDVAGCIVRDFAFNRLISSYEISSNRLADALYVLRHPACTAFDRTYFVSITNRLLSSGQPLRQLNIEGNNQ